MNSFYFIQNIKLYVIFLLLIPVPLNAQNIGVGTSTPEAKLHVVANTSEVLRLEAFYPFISFNTNGSQRGFIGGTPYGIEISSAAGYSGPIVLSPEGVQIMRVFPGGKVRIEGTTTEGGVGFSMGGYGEFQVDKPGIVSGRFIIKEDGKVGIGKTNPSELLDVAGTIRATAFKFENPKTYYNAIHPTTFIATTDPGDVRYNGGLYLAISPTFNELYAPINLPNAAIIKRIKIDLYDVSPTFNIYLRLNQMYPNGSAAMMNTMQSSGSSGDATIDSGPVSFVINNSTGAYSFLAFTTGIWPGNELVIRSIIIEYTISEL